MKSYAATVEAMFASQRAEAEAAAARAAAEAEAYTGDSGESEVGEQPGIVWPKEFLEKFEREVYCNSGAIIYCTSAP